MGRLPYPATTDWRQAYFDLRYDSARSFIGKGKKLISHNVETGTVSIKCVSFSMKGARFATSTDKNVYLWDTTSRVLLKKYKEHEAPVTSFSFFFREKHEFLVSGSCSGRTIKVWPVDEEEETESIRTIQIDARSSLGDIISSSKYIATFLQGDWRVLALPTCSTDYRRLL